MANRLYFILRTFFPLVFLLSFTPKASAQNWLWGRQGAGLYAESQLVATDALGNSYSAAYNTGATAPITFGSITLPIQPIAQMFWVKYDPAGNVLWAGSTTSSNGAGNNSPTSLCADPAGNLYILGISAGPTMEIGSFTLTNPYYGSSPGYQVFITKLSPTGTVLWVFTAPRISGGNITCDSAGNIYLASYFATSTLTVGPYTLTNADPGGNTYDVALIKYDPAGNLLWATSVGGTGNDEAQSATVSSTGDVYIAGDTYSPVMTIGPSVLTNATPAISKAFIAKFSPSGVPLWGQSGGGTGMTLVTGLAHDNSGNVYIGGEFLQPSISFGAVTITRPYPNPPTPTFASFLVRYSAAGLANWSQVIASGSQYDVRNYSIAVSDCKAWIFGQYLAPIVAGPGDTLAWTASRDPAFLVAYDLGGGPTILTHLACGGDDEAQIVCDATGNVLLGSDFSKVAAYPTFTVGPDSLPVAVDGPEYMFVAKFGVSPDTAYLHSDTTTCFGLSGDTLKAPAGYSSYYWDNNTPGSSRVINAAGKYYVYCFTCDSVVIDSFNVKIGTLDTTYKDTAICAPLGNARLNAPTGSKSFLWSTGDTTASITVNIDGSYWLSASSGCTALLDTFNVKISNIAFSLGKDSNACAPVTLLSPSFAQTRSWQDGSTNATYVAGSTGIYYLSISNQGCIYTDTISLHITDVSQHINDTLLCREQPVQLTVQANVPAGANVLWSDSSKQNTLYIKDTGSYWVTVTDSLCTGTDTFSVATEFCDCKAYVPNAFTPNADGKNDVFRPVFQPGCPISNYWFAVYNRWGQQVFLSKTIDVGWTGNFNGVYCEIGAYEWLLKYTGGTKNTKYILKGDMTLLR